MKKSSLIIPCHWNKELLKQIDCINAQSNGIKVGEIYGCLAQGPIGHGRSRKSVVDITAEDALDFRNYVKTLGIGFIYLLNAPFSFGGHKGKDDVKAYLDWIICRFKPNALMVASYELMEFIREHYPSDVRIYISTVAGIKNADQLEKYLDIKPSRLVPHHDVNRNFKDLEYLVKKTKKWNIEIELMLTESCLRGCPNRKNHYDQLGGGNTDKSFHTVCNTQRIMHPYEILNSNFIRPEDLAVYEEMGINSFKITGRSKPVDWLQEVVYAYVYRSYNGNLMRLLGTDPLLKIEEWVYVCNKSLGDFLKNFPKDQGEEVEKAYCKKTIAKLYNDGKFRISDGTRYATDSGGLLVCDTIGQRLKSILRAEKQTENAQETK